ncbi:alpha/beta hydrolase-fold protein [Algoriphagus halophytocola]|uniref:alpha/beta hydrolase n=1 Tax=Algoriphagus halophytocola TaxID=2991499 RepID=UPI0022DD390D|nr:alpha/beta hydrolase-fold protein [Algoriphagus sp. TR-M9]WBL43867.1 alpha/beta hydrolase-fold protein [Algoriphagus sp. TR-M9]
MRIKLSYLIGFTLLLGLVYLGYSKITEVIRKNVHQERVQKLTHTASQNVITLPDTITVDYLEEKRTLAIYLPKNYHSDSSNYPVIYFLDGQSLFDQKIQEGTEWQIDEVMDSLGILGQQQSIVVGIYNSADRIKEYKPFPETGLFADKSYEGDQHAAWIVETVKPWIDSNFRTKKDPKSSMIAGASLGGLMSYYILMHYPSTFGGAIVFSPSFWVNEKVFTLHQNNKSLITQKIYFNAGELESSNIKNIEKMRDILLKQGMPKENIRLDIEAGLGHSHSTWKNGFRKAYPWIVNGP